jgi:alkylmercury lyase-like protein/thioredoxin family protein
MRVEVLTVPDCPNGPAVRRHLAEALAGRPGVSVENRVVSTTEEAARYGMHGSPTILIDGRDPFAGPGTAASLACRLYRDAGGRVQGAPSAGQLRDALAAAGRLAGPAGRGGRGRTAPAEGGLRAVQQAVLRSFAATGHPPDQAALDAAAAPHGVPAGQILAELAAGDFLTLDGHGQITAAYPFSARPTGIEVTLPGGVRTAAMCAIDALGIPAMLDSDAVITFADPVSGEPVQVTFAGGAAAWQPAGAVAFYGARPGPGPSAAVCCGYLRFFASRATAGQFAAAHPEAQGTILDPAATQELGEQIFAGLLAGTA